MAVRVQVIKLRMSLAYLVAGDDGLVLVDAGLRGEESKILRAIHNSGAGKLNLIYITHAHLDHYGSAAALKRATGAPIAIHHQDEEIMFRGETPIWEAAGFGKVMAFFLPAAYPILRPEPAKADIILNDGDNLSHFGIRGKVLHTPGHTAGSSSLIIEDNIAFVGDLVTNKGRPRLQRYFAQNWSQLPVSLRRVQGLELEKIYPGHGAAPFSAKLLDNLT